MRESLDTHFASVAGLPVGVRFADTGAGFLVAEVRVVHCSDSEARTVCARREINTTSVKYVLFQGDISYAAAEYKASQNLETQE